MIDFMNHKVRLLLQTMSDRVKERMLKTDSAIETTKEVPTFFCPEYKKLSEYGYIRTIADIIKVLNEQNHYTDPEVLREDLQNTLVHYRERGTVSQSAIDTVRYLIHNYSASLFRDNKLNVDELARIIDQTPFEVCSPIDEVFNIRQKAKLLYAIEFANKICKYTHANDLVYDLQGLFWGESNWGWHVKLLDDTHPHIDYGVRHFLEGLKESWMMITRKDDLFSPPVLCNEMLEAYMFTDHERKIAEKGLVATLAEDYEEYSGCYSTRLLPMRKGTGPIYVYDDNEKIKKACHPSDDTLLQQLFYEKGFLSVLVNNMVNRHEYKGVENDRGYYYIPIKDYSMPIYHGDFSEMDFESKEEKNKFIESFL